MEEQEQYKRLFFAFEVEAPWPASLPTGRLLHEKQRHMTVAFLGHANYSKLLPLLPNIPLPPFKVGLAGIFEKIHFLPKGHPRVVAWHAAWFNDAFSISTYSRTLIDWLKTQGFTPDDRKEFLPHVTLCRAPFDFDSWRQTFQKLPLITKSLHLYESLGQLHYQPVWTYHLHAPFEELDHTADIAFKIYGETTLQLYTHAMTALAFKFPELLKFRTEDVQVTTVDEIVIELNRIVSRTDSAIGCPFKAISFHGEIEQDQDRSLTWEMIVDV